MIGEYYKKLEKFQDEQRASLITTIAQYFEERDIQKSLAIKHRLEGEILETFPTEKLEYLRTTKRGKLYNKYCNIKSAFKTAVSKHVIPKKKLKTDEHRRIVQRVLVPEDDAESAVRCLKYDNLSVEEFENCWKACCNYRLRDIQNLGTFDKWPYYKRPSGYRLVDIDFSVLYDNGQLLLEKWEDDSKKIIEFLSTDDHMKDKILKGMLNKVKSGNVTQNSRDASILWSLHGYGHMFWTFIQAHFYEIKSSMTFPKVHILSESIKSND